MNRNVFCTSAMFVLAAAGFATAASHDDAGVLLGPVAVERPLARGDEHRYQLALTKNECATVVVEQRGIDVIVQVRRADDSTIAEVQDDITIRGQERVDVVASADTVFAVVIKSARGTLTPGAYTVRVASRRNATEADHSMWDARALRTAAVGLEGAAMLDDARKLFERALVLGERARGLDAPFVGVLLFDLGGNALESRRDAAAEGLYRRAIAVFEKNWGAEHPYPAMARSRLAVVLERSGQGPKAEALIREAQLVIERTLGATHPWFAICLMTQANLRDDAGDVAKAEEIDRRALGILDQLGDTGNATYAGLLNNLGDLYRQKADYGAAESFFKRALTLTQTLEGAESYHVSIDYQNLGVVARERKNYPEAIDYDTRALAIRQRLVGPDHPDVAQLLNNLAIVYHLTGDDDKSIETHFRALRIWEKNGGPYQRGTLVSIGNLARMYASTGDVQNALYYQRRAESILERQLALNLAVGSERQKLAFASSASERTDRTLSLHLNQAPGDADAASLAALVLLQRKGRVLDAMIDTFAALRKTMPDANDRLLLDQLKTTTTRLAQRAMNGAAEAGLAGGVDSIVALEAEKERLEIELSERGAEFSARLQPVTLDAVQAAIPDDAALVEFAVFRPFDPKADRNAEAYAAPHYAVYVMRRHGMVRGRDLGPVSVVDRAAAALRRSLRDPTQTDVTEQARVVDDIVWRPVRELVGDAARLLIAPDGELNLLPFETLVDEQGDYLIQHYTISYLTSGRDLLRRRSSPAPRSAAVIVADPLFGEPLPGEASARYFAPLAATKEEGRAIKALFPEATLLAGTSALKDALQRLQGPLMLHIASHGFFLPDAGPRGTAAGTASSGASQNPLLRSGLALAGANVTRGGDETGILTALEASSLDLWGTKLVTLSACDTGVGEVRTGEGVYGLRRAFVLAGTETLVMSLWPVSDYIGRETMTAFYTALRAGLGRGDALREAKLALLKRKGLQHPFYWASFIESGEWSSLSPSH